MNKNNDLEFLKSKYMDQSYPEDMDKHILKTIAYSYENKFKKNYFKMYKRFALLAGCFCIVLFSINFNSNNVNVRYGYNTKTINVEDKDNISYDLNENEYIISVFPKDKKLNSDDLVYNISKLTGKEILFKDLLLNEVELSNIEHEFEKNILFKENKFYIDDDGSYVIIVSSEDHKNNLIKVDRVLQDLIFKEEYVLK